MPITISQPDQPDQPPAGLSSLQDARRRLSRAPLLTRLRETRAWWITMLLALGILTTVTAVALYIQVSKLLLGMNLDAPVAYTLASLPSLMVILLVVHMVADQAKGSELGDDLRAALAARNEVLSDQDEILEQHRAAAAESAAGSAKVLDTLSRVKEEESKGFGHYVTAVQAAARVLAVPAIDPPDPKFLMVREDHITARTNELLKKASSTLDDARQGLESHELLAQKRPRNPHLDRNPSYLADVPMDE